MLIGRIWSPSTRRLQNKWRMSRLDRPQPRRRGRLALHVLAILVAIGLSSWVWWRFQHRSSRELATTSEPLLVYCAAALRPPLEELAAAYQQEFGVAVNVQYGSSGSLEGQVRVAEKGDLYLPASVDPFLTLTRTEGLTREEIPLAHFRLVLATQAGRAATTPSPKQPPLQVQTLNDLLRPDVRFALANDDTAVAKMTRKVLLAQGQWESIRQHARVFKPTVVEVAQDIQLGNVDCGFVWDSTARQFGLDILDLPQLQQGTAAVAAAVLQASRQPQRALHFSRYLASPEKARAIWQKHHYEPVTGDAWRDVPELTVFSGGVNRLAIEETLKEFQVREGCRLEVVYNGCGVLVSQMQAGGAPDVYFACDRSFVTPVEPLFQTPTTISQTDMVILVPKGNPDRIEKLADLSRPGLLVGLADEELSALGALSKRLLQEAGIYEQVVQNGRVTTPTADLLVLQLVEGQKLSAAIVYRANCGQVADRTEMVRIDHPLAQAVQPIAISRTCRSPQLAQRLVRQLTSELSRQRFEQVGFHWRWTGE